MYSKLYKSELSHVYICIYTYIQTQKDLLRCKIIGSLQRFSTAFSTSLLLNPVGACFNYFASRSTQKGQSTCTKQRNVFLTHHVPSFHTYIHIIFLLSLSTSWNICMHAGTFSHMQKHRNTCPASTKYMLEATSPWRTMYLPSVVEWYLMIESNSTKIGVGRPCIRNHRVKKWQIKFFVYVSGLCVCKHNRCATIHTYVCARVLYIYMCVYVCT